VLRAFSRRREQIEAFLAGETSWAHAQAAAIRTRQAKGEERDETADRVAARARLGEHIDAEQLAVLLARGSHKPPALDSRRIGEVFGRLIGERGLTERSSSFTRGDVVRELAYQLGSIPTTSTVVDAADSFLALPEVVPLNERRFTTRGLEIAEQQITQLALRLAPRQLVLTRTAAEAGIARTEAERGFDLSREQRELVHGVTADASCVSVVRAVAGSGKTTTLVAIAEAYARAGIPVHGVAPTGAAARVMTEAGIPSRTVDRALLDREQALGAGIRPTPGIVLVDEAGTIGTRTLARLAQAVALADAKLVLVGDDAQLPPVPAGVTYADLLDHQRPVLALATPRRFLTPSGQPDFAEARALARLRAGTLAGAAAYLNHKQQTRTINTLDRGDALSAAAAWHATQVADGADPARIALIARSHELRNLLNQHARDSMRTAGHLGPDTHGLALAPLAVGDVVVCRRNDTYLAVTNGARGRITQITPNHITLAMTDQRDVLVPAAYARAGALEHAYAITGHLAQAATFDAAMVIEPYWVSRRL
jgi:ATP-dependent exoDNAse (exonuclease V) alpha subunit